MSVSTLIAALAPAYASDTRIGTFTTVATQLTSRDYFGVNYELAIALRVCHMIARNPSTAPGDAGAVTGKREGEMSITYQVSRETQKRHGDLCSTPYGAQLADLIEGNVMGAIVPFNPSFPSATSQGNFL